MPPFGATRAGEVACIESFFSHLKTGKLHLTHSKTFEEACQVVEEYITNFYNKEPFPCRISGKSLRINCSFFTVYFTDQDQIGNLFFSRTSVLLIIDP
ncbi:IS3 family transposase [Kroppenstedtia guangzhouensis]|uniref:IS3 family transposase n=1 Tax=Kroppenstedtia guangzhouensis TaxID=1274356 RepID=UPI00166395DB